MKKCFRCQRKLPDDRFSRNSSKGDGLQPDCKDCVAKHRKRYEPLADAATKICSRCSETKPINQYRVDRSKKDGHVSACKPCLGVSNPRAGSKVNMSFTSVEKQCSRCMRTLAHSMFHKSSRHSTGLAHICKACAKEKIRLWARQNPDKKRYNHQAYRARARSAVTPPINDFSDISCFFGGRCMHPGCEATEKLTLDHVLPLSMGGKHCNTNFQILCRSHNSSKGARMADYRSGRVLVAIIR